MNIMKTLGKVFLVILILWFIADKCNKEVLPPEPTIAYLKEDSIKAALREKQNAIEEKKFLKTKAGKIYKKHPEWTKQECIDVAKGNIWIGMKYSMLVYMWGKPDRANPSNYGNGNRWQWCWDGYNPGCFYDNNDDGIIDSYN